MDALSYKPLAEKGIFMKFDINSFFKDDIENKNHPSDFEYYEDTGVLILRLPFIKNEDVHIVSYAFLIKNSNVYIYHREKKEFDLLGGFEKLYRFLDVKVDKILAKIVKLHTFIADIEDRMYEDKTEKNFAKKYLRLKKELSLIERLMAHSLVALERFYKYYKNDLNELEFDDLTEHMKRAFSLSKSAIEKLDYLYDYHRARSDEKMNRIMFFLTIISGVFLPLTLITGFFGMNTGGLPLVDDPHGTLKAAIIGTLLEIPVIVWLYKEIRR